MSLLPFLPTFWPLTSQDHFFFMVLNYFWCPKSSPYLWLQTYLLTICTQCVWLKKALRYEVGLGILYILLITKNNFRRGRCRVKKKRPLQSCLPLWFAVLWKSKKEQKKHPWCVVKITTKELFLAGSFSKMKGALTAFLALLIWQMLMDNLEQPKSLF